MDAHTIWNALNTSSEEEEVVVPGIAILEVTPEIIPPTQAPIPVAEIKEVLSYIHDTLDRIKQNIESEDHIFSVDDHDLITENIEGLKIVLNEFEVPLHALLAAQGNNGE